MLLDDEAEVQDDVIGLSGLEVDRLFGGDPA
jgi:hypothetical protein